MNVSAAQHLETLLCGGSDSDVTAKTIIEMSQTTQQFSKGTRNISCLHFIILLVQFTLVYMLLDPLRVERIVDKKRSNHDSIVKGWSSSPTSSIFYNVTHPFFQRSVKPYTNLHKGHREMASPDYLSTASLSTAEKQILRYFFDDYLEYHAAHRRDATTRALVFRPSPSGMGDLFSFLSYAYWCSVVSRRLILIDWAHPFPITDLFQNARRSSTDVFYRNDERAPISKRLRKDRKETEDSLDDTFGDDEDELMFDPAEMKKRSQVAGGFNNQSHAYINDIIGDDLDVVEGILFSNMTTVFMQTKRFLRSQDLIGMVKRHLPTQFTARQVTEIVRQLNLVDFRRALLHQVVELSAPMQRDHRAICRQMRLNCGSSTDDSVTNDMYNGIDNDDNNNISGKDSSTKMLMYFGRLFNNTDHLLWSTGNSEQDEDNEESATTPESERRYIGVHARLGVGVGEMGHHRFHDLSRDMGKAARCLGRRAVQLAELGYRRELWDRMRAARPGAGAEQKKQTTIPIFLATDSPTFRPVFADTVRRLSRGTMRVVHGHWNVVHSNHVPWGHVLPGNDLDESQKANNGFWGLSMDLIMLGHAEHVISMYSTFPRFAVAIGDASTLIELRPERCFGE